MSCSSGNGCFQAITEKDIQFFYTQSINSPFVQECNDELVTYIEHTGNFKTATVAFLNFTENEFEVFFNGQPFGTVPGKESFSPGRKTFIVTELKTLAIKSSCCEEGEVISGSYKLNGVEFLNLDTVGGKQC